MKLALIKVFLHERQRKSHSVTFDYLIASMREAKLDIDIKICYSLDEIVKFKPDIVGISSATESYMIAKRLAKETKDKLGSLIIMGGTHITALPLTMSKEVDIGILGEGEVTIVELLKHIEKYKMGCLEEVDGISFWDGNRIIINKSRKPLPMDELPIPIYPQIKYDFGDAVAILTTRGCVNNCDHCSEQAIWRPFRYLSPQRLVDIIETHYKKSGKTNYVFLDDISFFNLKKVVGLKEELNKRNLLGKVKIVKGSVNSELVTDDIVRVLKDLGLKLAGFGLESASPKILNAMKKGRVTTKDFENCITLFGKHGIRSGASSVWGYPGETLESMNKTSEFLKKWNGKHKFKSFMQYCCQPLPGSPLWQRMYEKGKVSLDMDFSRIQIHPGDLDSNWLYTNDSISKVEFVKFMKQLRVNIKKWRKQ